MNNMSFTTTSREELNSTLKYLLKNSCHSFSIYIVKRKDENAPKGQKVRIWEFRNKALKC